MKDKIFFKIENNVLYFYNPQNDVNDILISNFYAEDTNKVHSERQDDFLCVKLSDIPELVYGNFGFFFVNKNENQVACHVHERFEREIYRFNKFQDLYDFYKTKGGNLAIRVRPVDNESEVVTTQELVELVKRHNIYFQQNLKYDKLAKSYKFDKDLRIEQFSQIVKTHGKLFSIGMCSYVKDVKLPTSTKIGRYCSIAPRVQAMGGGRHPQDRFTTSPVSLANPSEKGVVPTFTGDKDNNGFTPTYFKQKKLPIVIGNDVWIGNDVVIKQGVKIGDGAIIAQGAIITKDVPPFALVAGVPGVVKRYRFSPAIISKLLKLKWWDYAYWDFKGIYGADDIETFIDKLENLIKNGEIHPCEPNYITGKDILNIK